MTVATPSITTPELLDKLHQHFIKPDDTWAGAVCLTEVTAPGNSNRRADLVHIGLWSSRGAGGIDVCEIKTSRSDFRREIDQPAKAEAWWPYSSRFWIVSPGEHITPPEELPEGWGLMVPKATGRRFRVVVKPAEREPKLTEQLLVTLLKCTETTRVNALHRQREQLRADHYRQMQEQRRTLAGKSDPAVKERLDLLDQLEDALGMKLDQYPWGRQITPADTARALRALASGHAAVGQMQRDLEYRARELESAASALSGQAEKLRAAINVTTSQEN